MDENIDSNKIHIVDSIKLLTKDGITNICKLYGPIKKITFYQNKTENVSYVEFEDHLSAHKLLKEKSQLPDYLSINLIYDKKDKFVENVEVSQNLDASNINEEEEIKQAVYFGPNICVNSLIEESKQIKLKRKIISYNLENDNLFGKPLTSKWEKFEKFNFELHNNCFLNRFENCAGGEIKVEKKLGPSVFIGWVTCFNDGENVKNILQSISDDIESSDILNIDSLKRGMLVGAFDSVTNSYGRGYVTLVSGNSANIAMSDYGRVINTTNIRTLPEKYTLKPAYSFKMYTKNSCVLQLKENPYRFKVRSASSDRIVLIIFDENKEIKVQLKVWQPSVEEFGVPYIDFKSGSFVELLKLKDMNSVYLRSKEKHHFEFLFSSWNSLALYCLKTSQFFNREPLYGEIVGFKSTIIKNYTRGRIHKYLGDNTYCVKHMDNPCKENINISEMIELQFEHKIVPMSFIKVGLRDALCCPIQSEAKRFVEHVIGVRLSIKFDETKFEGWKHVDLQITAVKENLNNILYHLMEPSWLQDVMTDQRLESLDEYVKYFNVSSNELKENSVVNMKFVMYHEGIFYMRDKVFGKSFTILSDMIKEYCSINLHPYLPHNDELCLGRFPDGMWYRIFCEQVKAGELTKVHSVDIGNVAYLDSKNMRKLPVELIFHPTHVYLCLLDTSKLINLKKIKLLKEYENIDCEFTVTKNLGKYHYSIKCPLLEDILV